jgi:NDP-sugar pyrophosphorylase family protein
VPGLWIDPTAEIDPTARIVGPVYVGPGARIGADAVVIGPVIIGPGVEIGADAVVNGSILWRSAKVGNGALVEQTVMAANSMVAGGVEVRGAIVVEQNLSSAERQSLGGSMDFGSADIPVKERWWRRVWSGFRSTVRTVGLDRAAALLQTTAPAR